MIVDTEFVGVVDGLETWEVTNPKTGEVIGYNVSAPSEDS